MEPFEVRVRRWVEDTSGFLERIATDPRCPEDVRREALRWQQVCAHLDEGDPRAWWPDLSEDLP